MGAMLQIKFETVCDGFVQASVGRSTDLDADEAGSMIGRALTVGLTECLIGYEFLVVPAFFGDSGNEPGLVEGMVDQYIDFIASNREGMEEADFDRIDDVIAGLKRTIQKLEKVRSKS